MAKKLPAGWYYQKGRVGGPRLSVPHESRPGDWTHPVELVRSGKLAADVRTWVRGMKEVYADCGVEPSLVEMVHALVGANANRWPLSTEERSRAVVILVKEFHR